MSTSEKKLRVCKKGHKYYKTSDCPTCPICEQDRKPENGFMAKLSAPAIRALEALHIKTLKQLAKFTEKEIARQHGMGPSGVRKLKQALNAENLDFKNKS